MNYRVVFEQNKIFVKQKTWTMRIRVRI